MLQLRTLGLDFIPQRGVEPLVQGSGEVDGSVRAAGIPSQRELRGSAIVFGLQSRFLREDGPF